MPLFVLMHFWACMAAMAITVWGFTIFWPELCVQAMRGRPIDWVVRVFGVVGVVTAVGLVVTVTGMVIGSS
jgi:hypothetical protein